MAKALSVYLNGPHLKRYDSLEELKSLRKKPVYWDMDMEKEFNIYMICSIAKYRFEVDGDKIYVVKKGTDGSSVRLLEFTPQDIKNAFDDDFFIVSSLGIKEGYRTMELELVRRTTTAEKSNATYAGPKGSMLPEDEGYTIVLSIDAWGFVISHNFDNYSVQNSPDECPVILECLYIGQSCPEKSGDAVDRLTNGHEKLQKALATRQETSDVLAGLFEYIPQEFITITPDSHFDADDLAESILAPTDLTKRELVDLAEIGLITFFRPELNTHHKRDDFKKNESSKIRNALNHYEAIVIEVDAGNFQGIIESEHRRGSNAFSADKRYLQCNLIKNNNDLIWLDADGGEIFDSYK